MVGRTRRAIALAAVGLVSGRLSAQAFPVDPQALRSRLMEGADRVASELFERADANHDGFLSKAEVEAFSSSAGGGAMVDPEVWAKADLNHDGYVTLPELRAAMRAAMDSAR